MGKRTRRTTSIHLIVRGKQMPEEHEKNSKRKQKTQRRNKYEIWIEILEACLWTSRTQSWLMRKINLKTSNIKQSLDFLISRKLLIHVENEFSTYKTTEKGSEALKQFYDLILNYFEI